jgi:hypothetical protein
MVDVRQTVTRKEGEGVDEEGNRVQQRSQQIHTESSTTKKNTISNLVWFLFGLFAIFLILRFVLKLSGANSNNGFVSFIYSVSKVLSAPFDSIFGVSTVTAGSTKSVFEPSILVAIVIYALIAWGIVKLINITSNPNH